MAVNKQDLAQEVQGFLNYLGVLYGHYLDSTMGFKVIHDRFVELQQRSVREFPDIDFDSRTIFMGTGAPDDPSTIIQHQTTQGEYKRRNVIGGSNHVLAAQLLIVLIFAFWESRYRASIATALGKESADVKVPIMGDLRRLRNDIVHCAGVIQKETALKLEVLTTVKSGEAIVLTAEDVLALIQSTKAAIVDLANKALAESS